MRQVKLPPGVYMQLASPDVLRAWLKHRGLSYADLGAMVGVSKQFIGQLATGQKKTCRPDLAARIELALLPPLDKRGPGDMPLFVQRSSITHGDSLRNRRRTLATSDK